MRIVSSMASPPRNRLDPKSLNTRITTNVTTEDLQRKDKQQAEMRQALQLQMQEKQRRKQEERQRSIDEDRKQEARIRKDLEQINAEYTREKRSQSEFYQTQSEQFSEYKPEIRQKRGKTPMPVEQKVAVVSEQPARTSLPPKRLVHIKELWRDPGDLIEKNAQLEEIIRQLKEDASGMMRGSHDLRADFEAIRRETQVKAQARSTHDSFKPRVKPFALAARSLVHVSKPPLPVQTVRRERDYSEIDNLEIRHQLGKLDSLLSMCSELPAPPAPTNLKIERVESPELRSTNQSVPLTFALHSS